MKKLFIGLILSALSLSVFAQDVRSKRQPIGEQCAVIANYQEPVAGSCEGAEVLPGDAQVSGMMSVERGKSYYAVFTLINQNDQIEEQVATDVYTAARDDNWIIDNYYLALSRYGQYAIKLEIFNALTNVAVCTDQALIHAAR